MHAFRRHDHVLENGIRCAQPHACASIFEKYALQRPLAIIADAHRRDRPVRHARTGTQQHEIAVEDAVADHRIAAYAEQKVAGLVRQQRARLDDFRRLRDGLRNRPGRNRTEQRQPADAERMAALRREPHDPRTPANAAAQDFHEAVARHLLQRRREAAFRRKTQRLQQVGDEAGPFCTLKIRQRARDALLCGGEVLVGGSWHYVVKYHDVS